MKKLILLGLLVSPIFAQHTVTLTINYTQGSGDPATGFNIWRIPNTLGTSCPSMLPTGTPYAVVSSITNTTYVDTAVSAGTTLCYGVTAFNGSSNSAMSNEVSCTIPFSLSAPNITAVVK